MDCIFLDTSSVIVSIDTWDIWIIFLPFDYLEEIEVTFSPFKLEQVKVVYHYASLNKGVKYFVICDPSSAKKHIQVIMFPKSGSLKNETGIPNDSIYFKCSFIVSEVQPLRIIIVLSTFIHVLMFSPITHFVFWNSLMNSITACPA